MIIEAEYCVLACLMGDSQKITSVQLSATDFSTTQNQEIFTAIEEIVAKNEVCDLLTVSDLLEYKTGRKWLSLLGNIMKDHYSENMANYETYAKALVSETRKKTGVEIANNLADALSNKNPMLSVQEHIDQAVSDLMKLNFNKQNHNHTLRCAMAASVDEMDESFKRHGSGKEVLMGIPTGLADINKALGGLHDSDLHVIAARPAMGKTSLLLNLASASGRPAGLISAEQPFNQIGMRMISINGKVALRALRTGNIQEEDWAKIVSAVTSLNDREIQIFDKPSPHINEIIREARRWHFEYGMEVLFVDYLQCIEAPKNQPRHEQVAEVVTSLKNLARELDIPVVVLAQVNREVEKRSDKRPLPGDIKDSGVVEQVADIIMTLYRDEVYNPRDAENADIAEIDIQKNRHGPTGIVKTVWSGEFLHFGDINPHSNVEQLSHWKKG